MMHHDCLVLIFVCVGHIRVFAYVGHTCVNPSTKILMKIFLYKLLTLSFRFIFIIVDEKGKK